MDNPAISNAIERMDKSLAVLKNEYKTLRVGRANPQILDRIMVDYYGTPTPINQIGNISAPEPRVLMISVWDTKMLSTVEKAIQKSDLGINPSNDGKVIRLVIPELTEERRKELVKLVRKLAEDDKVAVRAVRRDAIENIKKQRKDNLLTEDDQKQAESEMQKITDKQIAEIDKLSQEKEKEIMSV